MRLPTIRGFVAVLSLLLFVATSAMWGRSYWWYDLWAFPTPAVYSALESSSGGLAVEWTDPAARSNRIDGPPSFLGFCAAKDQVIMIRVSYHLRTEGHWKSWSDTRIGTIVRIPYCFIALLFLVLPAMQLRRPLVEMQRARNGRCRTCGYDLRATPDRCPECGTRRASPSSCVLIFS
jgi:hypothetical protein